MPEVTVDEKVSKSADAAADAALVTGDLLVEDVSIDGRCGVY